MWDLSISGTTAGVTVECAGAVAASAEAVSTSARAAVSIFD